jgi:hemerythrin-like metal-binding protein
MTAAFDFRRGYWSPRMALGQPAMDAAHRCLLEELERISTLADAEFLAGFEHFISLVDADFREEEAMMEGIEYSALPTHREQHARLLGYLRQTASRMREGDIAAGREVTALMPGWFELHIETMDGALAMQCQYSQQRRIA